MAMTSTWPDSRERTKSARQRCRSRRWRGKWKRSRSAPIGENLASFALYSLVTSTLTWDTVRAVTTVVGIALIGPAVRASLRRAKLPSQRASARRR
jgi:hypothetical protein